LVVNEKIVDDGFLLTVLWDEFYKNKYSKKKYVKDF
jgi:hypothetical protein